MNVSRPMVCLAFALIGCASLPVLADDSLDQELEELLSTLPGRYAGPITLQEGGEAVLYHTIETVSLPELGETVIHHVISRVGFDDRVPFQQKFYVMDRDPNRPSNRMSSVVLMRSDRWSEGAPLPADDLIRFPQPDCAIVWQTDSRGFVARVRKGDCVYQSAVLGGAIIPDMTYIVTDQDFGIQDLLYREDGTPIVSGTLVRTPRVAESPAETVSP